MDSFETKLYKASAICDGQFKYLDEFSKMYTFCTENVSGYMKHFDFDGKRLLTVGSSGDQVLNSFMNGARDITLFDINPYAKFYIYLKIASIVSLSYDEFINFFFKHTESPFRDNREMFSRNTFNKIKSTLRLFDYESFLFFDELFSLYDGELIRRRLFDDDEDRCAVIKGFNSYLRDEDSYNKLKSIIKKIYFKYVEGNIFNDKIDGKFDNIFLSNLSGLVKLDEFRNLLERLDRDNLNDNGSILFGYLWDTKFNSDKFKDDWREIYRMPVVREKLGDFISEHHGVNGYRDILWEEDRKSDLVLIYRKK